MEVDSSVMLSGIEAVKLMAAMGLALALVNLGALLLLARSHGLWWEARSFAEKVTLAALQVVCMVVVAAIVATIWTLIPG